MSNAQPQILATPSRNKTGSRSQAGSLLYEQPDIKDDLTEDIRNSTKCGVDALLKYFIFLVLEEDDPEKRRLNELQTKIEKLQSQRYYNLDGNGDTTTPTDGTGTAEAEPAGTQTAATGELQDTSGEKNVDLGDDTQFASEEERCLVKERDEKLDALLHEVLKAVLPVANKKDVRETLVKFAEAFAQPESARYVPYVVLCNNVLKHLHSVGGNLPVRKPDVLNIRFNVHDTTPVVSTYGPSAKNVIRKPDIVITSTKSHQVVQKTFEWPEILSCGEFKVLKARKIPEEGKMIINQRKPFVILNPPQVLPHAVLPTMDSDAVRNAPIVAEGSGSKRARDGQSVAENPPPSKKPRQLKPETPSGSNINSNNSAATSNANSQANAIERNTTEAINGRAQCASYAMEMLSYSAGVHHAINLLFTDGHFWIWYYDRQGIVQSDGISIFADFPRFLVLLFAFQRFTVQDWGIIPCLNPKAVHALRPRGQGQPPAPGVSLSLQHLSGLWAPDNKLAGATVEVNTGVFLSHKPHCLAGRATSVFPAEGVVPNSSEKILMVCKIYHPEVQRRHEGQTLQVVHQIAEEHDRKMVKHLPSMRFYGDVPGCTTQRIRSMVNRKWKGHRTLRILGLKKLVKITSLEGANFIKAWLETVICHSFLWKHYVEHGDPSLSNIMYDPDEDCGVLSDFDLSLLQWEPRVVGTDRTGTVPFMAVDLLTKGYWTGAIPRFYHHEMESFIWILAYVVLYDKVARKAVPAVEAWRTSNYSDCREKKVNFYTGNTLMEVKGNVQPSYEVYWPIVHQLCHKLRRCHLDNDERASPAFGGPVVDAPFEASQQLWGIFITALQLIKDIPDLPFLLGCLQDHKPSFRMPNLVEQERLRRKYNPIFKSDT